MERGMLSCPNDPDIYQSIGARRSTLSNTEGRGGEGHLTYSYGRKWPAPLKRMEFRKVKNTLRLKRNTQRRSENQGGSTHSSVQYG